MPTAKVLDPKEIPADPIHHKLTKEDVQSLSEAVDKLESMRESIAGIKTEMAVKEEPKDGIPSLETEPEIKKTKAEKMLAKKVQYTLVSMNTKGPVFILTRVYCM